MTDATILTDLEKVFTEKQRPWILAALRQEHVVWDALENPDFWSTVLERGSQEHLVWSPGALALLALGSEQSAESLSSTPSLPLDLGIRQRAIQAYETFRRDIDAKPLDLEQAGLLALALRERYRKIGSWNGLAAEVGAENLHSWRSAFSCLYGMLPDPGELLEVLFHDARSYPTGISVFLSQPIPPDRQTAILAALIGKLERNVQVQILRRLKKQRPRLTAQVVFTILSHLPSSENLTYSSADEQLAPDVHATQLDRLYQTNRYDSLVELAYLAELHELADQAGDALKLFKRAKETAIQITTELLMQRASLAAKSADAETALDEFIQAQKAGELSLSQRAETAINLIHSGMPAIAEQILPPQGDHPLILLARAQLIALGGNRERALQQARQLLSNSSSNDSNESDLLEQLAHFFLQVGNPTDALQAAEMLVRLHPANPDFFAILAQARQASGQIHTATIASHLAVQLAPERLELRRLYATTLESGEDWHAAAMERRNILEMGKHSRQKSGNTSVQTETQLEDLCAYAHSSLQSGEIENARQASLLALELNPNEGLAYTLLGQANTASGEYEAAAEHFLKATQLAPYHPQPWLALSQAQIKQGEVDKSIETLHTAAQAIPDSAEIQLALGEALVETATPSQALLHLRRAADLVGLPASQTGTRHSSSLSKEGPAKTPTLTPLAVRVAGRLGKTLHQLGFFAEARHSLSLAYRANPQQVDLARRYAESLLAVGESREALAALSIVVQSKPEDSQPYLDYARALLQVGEQPETAVDTLQLILQKEPEHLEAQALLAEGLAANGQHTQALKQYQQAMDTPLVHDPRWMVRLSMGLGHVAMLENRPELAIAALQEALLVASGNQALYQSLSEAYQAAGLKEDALVAARRALELSPADMNTLLWFVEHLLALGGPGTDSEAMSVLSRAAELAPQDADMLLRLADIQIQTGQVQQAQQTISQAVDLEDITLENLHRGARALLQLNDPQRAIQSLERVRGAFLTDLAEASLDLLMDLCEAYQQVGDFSAALVMVEEALQRYPQDAGLNKIKARIHLKLGAPLAALACLQQAINLSPNDPEAHRQVMEIQRSNGNLVDALEHAQRWVKCFTGDPMNPKALSARSRAADLAFQMLQPELADSLLSGTWDPKDPETNLLDYLDFYGLIAELALENNDEISAAEAINTALEVDATQPRILGLQARLFARQGQFDEARRKLTEALTVTFRKESINSQRQTLALAALEMHDWESALKILEQMCANSKSEPFVHLNLARALVLRAEAQQLAELLQVTRHAPGKQALSDQARRSFEEAMQQAGERLHQGKKTASRSLEPAILLRWLSRGRIVFTTPEGEYKNLFEQALVDLSRLPAAMEDSAAYLNGLRKAGQRTIAEQTARDYPNNSHVQGQLALTLMEEDPIKAMEVALSAVENLPEKQKPIYAPLYSALLSRATHKAGETGQAYQAIHLALADWPDEANWHVYAAELSILQRDLSNAIQHLEKAASLEPENVIFHERLAETARQTGAIQRAIHSYEAISKLRPEDPQPWLALAQIHLEREDLPQAARCAEKAIELEPENLAALLLRVQIALQAGDARGAHNRAQAAVRLNPENAAALALLARSLAGLNRTTEALETYERAVTLAEDPLPVFLERAQLLRNTQGSQLALEALMGLAQKYPTEPAVLAPLAEVLAEAGRSEAALETAQSALQNNHELLDENMKVKLHTLIGRNLRRTGQLDQAIHHLSQAIQLKPGQIDAYLELGKAHMERRQNQQALQILQQAMRVAPDDPRSYFQAGLAFKDNKDYPEAERMIRKAAELSPHDLSIQRMLGSLVALNLVQDAQ